MVCTRGIGRAGRRRDLEEETPMSKNFRAGMVGAGNICEFHVARGQGAAPTVELVGVTDLDAARAAGERREAGARSRSTSLDALVDAGANVIHVLTPPAAHAKVALAALERGCHVLIEKPIAEDEAEALEDRPRREGRRASSSTVNHSLLYDPQVKRALDAVTRRRARPDRLGRHPARLGVPAVRGRPAAAVVPRRRLSVPRHRRPLPVPDPGAARPDRGRSTPSGARSAAIRTSRSTSGARSCAASAGSVSSS